MANSTQISFRVDAKLLRDLNRIAKEDQRSLSDKARLILQKYVREHDEAARADAQ